MAAAKEADIYVRERTHPHLLVLSSAMTFKPENLTHIKDSPMLPCKNKVNPLPVCLSPVLVLRGAHSCLGRFSAIRKLGTSKSHREPCQQQPAHQAGVASVGWNVAAPSQL